MNNFISLNVVSLHTSLIFKKAFCSTQKTVFVSVPNKKSKRNKNQTYLNIQPTNASPLVPQFNPISRGNNNIQTLMMSWLSFTCGPTGPLLKKSGAQKKNNLSKEVFVKYKKLSDLISHLKKLSEKEIQKLSLRITDEQLDSLEAITPLKEQQTEKNEIHPSKEFLAFQEWYGRIMNSAETMEVQIREKLKEGELVCIPPEEEHLLDHTEFSKIFINFFQAITIIL
jgi:hypothetical protein